MRLWRIFPWNPSARPGERGHALHLARDLQGGGRHDNPDRYGALYVSEAAHAAAGEVIAHLRGQRLDDADLERSGLRLALVPLDAEVEGDLWDLDDPRTLARHGLRPSRVATRDRAVTQRWAADLFRARPLRAGLRWWSTLESLWMHVTLFDRAMPRVALAADPEPLRTVHAAVRTAADALGIALVNTGRGPPAMA